MSWVRHDLPHTPANAQLYDAMDELVSCIHNRSTDLAEKASTKDYWSIFKQNKHFFTAEKHIDLTVISFFHTNINS